MSWKTMLLEETEQMRVWLRRYRSVDVEPCSQGGYCTAKTHLEDGPWHKIGDYSGAKDTPFNFENTSRSDARWPTHCQNCGKEFVDSDEWQFSTETLYRRPDNGELILLSEAQPGMMWETWWFPREFGSRFYQEGWADKRPQLHIMTPVREWLVDGPASNGEGWDVTGEYPNNLTARPSIGQQDSSGNWLYHGWLTDGVLSSDIDGKTFPQFPNTA